MNFLEKNLEDIIWENAQTVKGRDELAKRGLIINGKLMRQVSLGGYGVADLISICLDSNYLDICIYELKKGQIDVNALMQACRYYTCIKRLLEKTGYDRLDGSIKMILIGDSIDMKGDFVFLYNLLRYECDIYTYSYCVDGVHFEYKNTEFIRKNERLQDIDLNFKKSDIAQMMFHLV